MQFSLDNLLANPRDYHRAVATGIPPLIVGGVAAVTQLVSLSTIEWSAVGVLFLYALNYCRMAWTSGTLVAVLDQQLNGFFLLAAIWLAINIHQQNLHVVITASTLLQILGAGALMRSYRLLTAISMFSPGGT